MNARTLLLRTVVWLALAAWPATAGATTLFGLVDTGELYASADGGVNWVIRSALPVSDAVALAAGATTSRLYLASEAGSFYRSSDAGMTWTAVGTIPASDVTELVTFEDQFLLFTESGSVYRSLDLGANWSAISTITASDIVSAVKTSGYYVVLSRTGSVYRSPDNGLTWSAVGTITTSNAVDVRQQASILYVLTATGEIARSQDFGVSWSFVSTLSQSGMTALASTGTELVASTEAGEAALSSDGLSWTWQGAIGQLIVRALASDLPTITGVSPPGVSAFHFALPWPNPARAEVSLAVELERTATVSIAVFDGAGRLVAKPVAGELFAAGRTVRPWRPRGLAVGRYVVRARIGDRVQVHPLVWLGGR